MPRVIKLWTTLPSVHCLRITQGFLPLPPRSPKKNGKNLKKTAHQHSEKLWKPQLKGENSRLFVGEM